MTEHRPVVIAAIAGVIGLIAAPVWPGIVQHRLHAVAQIAAGALETPAARLLPPFRKAAGFSAGPRIIHVPPNFGGGAGDSYENDALAPGQPADRDGRRRVAPPAPSSDPGERQWNSSSRSESNRALSAKGSLTPVYPTPRWTIGGQSGKPPGKAQADAQTPR
jgi:hypothetical protein